MPRGSGMVWELSTVGSASAIYKVVKSQVCPVEEAFPFKTMLAEETASRSLVPSVCTFTAHLTM